MPRTCVTSCAGEAVGLYSFVFRPLSVLKRDETKWVIKGKTGRMKYINYHSSHSYLFLPKIIVSQEGKMPRIVKNLRLLFNRYSCGHAMTSPGRIA